MIGIVSWLLGFVLSNILLFCLEKGFTPTFYVTIVFVWLAFVSALVFQIVTWKKCNDTDTRFMNIPAITISITYMIIQIPICIIFSLGSKVIPVKATVLVNSILFIMVWLIILGTLLGHNHIRKVNDRQKKHHAEL